MSDQKNATGVDQNRQADFYQTCICPSVDCPLHGTRPVTTLTTSTTQVDPNRADIRSPYEQQEFQRKNPHLFTTPTQSVNPDGTLTTYQQVTAKLQAAYEKLVALAREVAASKDFNADYWFLMDELQDTKQSTDYLVTQMKLCLRSFTENYARMHERHHRGSDLRLERPETREEL